MQLKSKDLEVVVVGCGISGLSSGILLLEQNYDVKIVARERPPLTTSDAAAAVWFPYEVPDSPEVLRWARLTLEELKKYSKDPDYPVSMVKFVELFKMKREDPWWKDDVCGFRHADEGDLPEGYIDGYVCKVPLIESSAYLQQLMDRFLKNGGTIEEKEIGDLDELYGEKQLIINCSGVWSRELANDRGVYPIRGQVVILEGSQNLKRCLVDEQNPVSLTYIVPRSEDCVLGGTAERRLDALDVQLQEDKEQTKEILRKCEELEPLLVGAVAHKVKVGLRPGRQTVRLDLERVADFTRCGVIHNYGHGGSGFTLSWGCAAEVVKLADQFYGASHL
jgi:D-amino-acid oxidase